MPLRPRNRDALGAMLEGEPGAVFAALRRPTVGALIRVSRGGSVHPQLDDVLAAELGLDGAPDVPCLLRRSPGGAFHSIEGGLVLATVDTNPLAMLEAHPEKLGNAIDLGSRSAETWCEALRDALATVDEHMPVIRSEIDLVVHQFIPVGYDAERHLSASYAEAIGTIYLSLHPSSMTMVEAVIHEHQHNKLNALLELDPLLDNAFWPLFTSPVRPDPRPLHGILLAVHAFLPVEALYRRRIEAGHEGLERRYDHIVRGNREGAAVLLEHAAPTAMGAALLDEIRRLS